MENPIVGLIMGSIFGACLVLSGLTDPDQIIGTLRLKNFHAIRTVAVFILVGMLGTWILELVVAANLNIKPAAVLTMLIGGAFLGVGLGLTGFSPGTGLASAASGRMDALTTLIGMLFGAHVYILIYPTIILPLEKIAHLGRVRIPEITGTSTSSWIIPIFATGSLALFLTRSGKQKETERRSKVGEQKMKEDFIDLTSPIPIPRKKDLYIQKDFVRSTRIIRRWKNFLFIIIVLCLLLLQTSFWLINHGYITLDKNTNTNAPAGPVNEQQSNPVAMQNGMMSSQLTRPTAKGPEKPPGTLTLFDIEVTFERVSSVTNITNTILALASAFYALTIFCSLAASFGANLGGLRHISQAFVFSLVLLILLLPWQLVFNSTVLGAIFTPRELATWPVNGASNTFGTALLYLRFTGYSTLVFMLLILAQFRSFLWSRNVIRRLEQ